jgi:hypothetical protein
MPTGNGFLSGYGWIARSAYATPIDLGFKNWTLDFAPDGIGLPFPTEFRTNPITTQLEWRTDDWDPGLRFWTLPFDPQLTEWLQDLDMASPAVMAAREFASHHPSWQLGDTQLVANGWLKESDLAWKPGWKTATSPTAAQAWTFINGELDQLVDLMEDDRERYMAEALEQADGIPRYFVQLMALDYGRKPWTMELIRAALAIGNLVYMHYKKENRRVRPSTICPGLAPSFGPPGHPAFPSGHSFLGNFIALLLLEIPEIAARFGIGLKADGTVVGSKPTWAQYQGDDPAVVDGPLFWLARRVAKTRERLGLHYPSDSNAGRHLAGGVWSALFELKQIAVPTLARIVAKARAEWV